MAAILGVSLFAACVEPSARDTGSGSADTSGVSSGLTPHPSGGAESSAGVDGSSSGDDGSSGGGELPSGPARYDPHSVHSPITDFVAQRLTQIAAEGPGQREDVFAKVGASSTVSHNTLHCFADVSVDLGAHEQLRGTLELFLGGDADGTTPFDRDTLAAESGRTAAWAISGMPSPLELELEALAPRLALVHYGTNDMQFGATFDGALAAFYENMTALLGMLQDQGVVPIVFGITRRADSAAADRWVATYNAVIRGLAQAHQVPFVDMHRAIDPLPGHGLSSDGLHLEAFADGACRLTTQGLMHGYNMRNLIALEALDRAAAVLVDDAGELDPREAPEPGDGSMDAPFVVTALPWADARDTGTAPARVDAYPACDPTVDESGPELWYRLELDAPQRIRALVLDGLGTDIDVHLLDDSRACRVRDNRLVQGTLEAGTHYIVADSWSDGELLYSGEYLLVIVECDDDDPECDAPL